MTSSTARPTRTRRSAAGAGRARARRAGFTLLEVLLALGLALLLVGIGTAGLMAWGRGRRLEEGTLRVETLLRKAGVEARCRGRRFRVVLGDEEGRLAVRWEPQPLVEPGVFVAFTEVHWAEESPDDLVWVSRFELTGDSAFRTLVFDDAGFGMSAESMEDYVTFEPDGSSDSARIELAPHDTEDARRAIVELNGTLGTVESRVLTPSELDELYEGLSDPS